MTRGEKRAGDDRRIAKEVESAGSFEAWLKAQPRSFNQPTSETVSDFRGFISEFCDLRTLGLDREKAFDLAIDRMLERWREHDHEEVPA